MSKRKTVLIISYISFAFLCLVIYIIILSGRAAYYKNESENNYKEAFSEFVTNFNEMSTALEKSVYSRSPEMLASVCTQVYGKSQSAQMALASLPLSDGGIGATSSFVSKVGDYAYSVAKNASSGITDESSFEVLTKLSDVTSSLSDKFREMYADLSSGSLTIYDLSDKYAELSNIDSISPDDSLADTFADIEEQFPEVPSLIYDGPFSDDVDTGSYSILEDKSELAYDQAAESIKTITGCDDLEPQGEIYGQIKLYTFENNHMRIEMTANGGYIYSIKSYDTSSAQNVSVDEAIQTAITYLDSLGYKDMESTYHMIQNNSAIINFAFMDGEYICYPDLIKVTVSLETGDVSGIDAAGYIRNHKDRDIPEEKYDMAQCRNLVPDNLKILAEGKSIIPTYGKKEVSCYEFKCENDKGQHYVVYVGTQSGQQEDILILIEDESGTLAI